MYHRWPTYLPPPTHTGSIRFEPQDFYVQELPAYLPSGNGEHYLFEIEKTNLTTEEVTRAIARHCNIKPAEIGTAGLKDRRAVTRQWFSIPAQANQNLSTLQLAGVRVLQSGFHSNKLKTGHLKGNHFRILIRNLSPQSIEDISNRCKKLSSCGVPNYFGPQRFGPNNRNELEGLALLTRKRRNHDRRSLRFLLSAVQSGLFNDLLAKRIHRNLYAQVLEGDILAKEDSGGMFLCTDPVVDQARLTNREIHPTGPIFGPKMKTPLGLPAEIEQEVLEESGIDAACFRKFPKLTLGTRRPLRVFPTELEIQANHDNIFLCFSLKPGSYATGVLRELIHFLE